MISNCDESLAGALKSGVSKGRVSNEQFDMANAVFVAFSDSSQDLDSDDEQRKVSPSKRQRLAFLPSLPTRTGQRKFKEMEEKRRVLMLGLPSKEEWHTTITSRKGKGLKVSDEDRAKIVQWVKDHPDVVASPVR